MASSEEETKKDTNAIPTTMKRLVVTAPGKDVASCKIEIQADAPVPRPASGEVLIKVAAAAINPSDYSSWYRCKPEHCPVPMGKEGCGTVVSTGGGLSTLPIKIGTKVGFIVQSNPKQGAYSEYVAVTVVGGVFPMPQDLPVENAASFFVNPYTAIGILDTAKKESSKALVHTAAASQLGQMIVKLAPSEGVEVINVVRREEQAELLRKIGAKHVVVTGGSDEETWKAELKSKVDELGATVAFDAVAGKSTGDMMDALPKRGTVYVYGGLSGRVENVDPMALIYHEKKIKGFLLTNWIKQGGMLSMGPRMYAASGKVNAGLKEGGWSASQFEDTTLDKAHADIVKLIDGSSTGQKLRIRFDYL